MEMREAYQYPSKLVKRAWKKPDCHHEFSGKEKYLRLDSRPLLTRWKKKVSMIHDSCFIDRYGPS